MNFTIPPASSAVEGAHATHDNELHSLPQTYCQAWQNKDSSHLLSLFADDSVMTDHGAQLHIPRKYLGKHHQHWNGAHENFEVILE